MIYKGKMQKTPVKTSLSARLIPLAQIMGVQSLTGRGFPALQFHHPDFLKGIKTNLFWSSFGPVSSTTPTS
jgi:hypothetical protein